MSAAVSLARGRSITVHAALVALILLGAAPAARAQLAAPSARARLATPVATPMPEATAPAAPPAADAPGS